MASASRFGLYSCSTVTGSAVTTVFNQMVGFEMSPGASRTRIHVGGDVDPKAHIEAFSDPRIRFGTRDLTKYWGIVSATTGVALTGTATFRLQERGTLAGVFESGATAGETYTVAQGILLPRTLSANQDDTQGAIIQSELICEHNGSVAPIVKNTNADITVATAPAFNSEFFMGPVYINSVEVPGIISTNIDFGIEYSSKRTSGQVYSTLGAIVRRAPMMSFTTLKADTDTASSAFLRALAGVVAIYFWKGADSGNRVAIASTVHLKISAAAGSWGNDSISVQELDDATDVISIMPTGSLSMSIASAIP